MSDLEAANEGTSIGAHARRFSRTSMSCSSCSPRPWRSRSGASPLGYLIAAGAWVLQRVLQQLDRRWIAGRGDDARFGLNLVDGFGRIWLLAGAIVLAAVIGGRGDGLTAALVIFCVYSIAFAMRVVEGRPGGTRP